MVQNHVLALGTSAAADRSPDVHLHNSVWVTYGQHSIDGRPKDDMMSPADNSEFHRWFAEFGWTQPSDLVTYNGPRAINGEFYMIWYSPSEQKAFLASGYW